MSLTLSLSCLSWSFHSFIFYFPSYFSFFILPFTFPRSSPVFLALLVFLLFSFLLILSDSPCFTTYSRPSLLMVLFFMNGGQSETSLCIAYSYRRIPKVTPPPPPPQSSVSPKVTLILRLPKVISKSSAEDIDTRMQIRYPSSSQPFQFIFIFCAGSWRSRRSRRSWSWERRAGDVIHQRCPAHGHAVPVWHHCTAGSRHSHGLHWHFLSTEVRKTLVIALSVFVFPFNLTFFLSFFFWGSYIVLKMRVSPRSPWRMSSWVPHWGFTTLKGYTITELINNQFLCTLPWMPEVF